MKSPRQTLAALAFGRRRGKIMTDVSILVMVVSLSFVFQFSDATIGTRTAEEDFTWKYNGEVNIGECPEIFNFKEFVRFFKN